MRKAREGARGVDIARRRAAESHTSRALVEASLEMAFV
jgi:hypothetical protein